jgi:hypothetical protein
MSRNPSSLPGSAGACPRVSQKEEAGERSALPGEVREGSNMRLARRRSTRKTSFLPDVLDGASRADPLAIKYIAITIDAPAKP